MVFTESQLADYRESGFTSVPNFFPARHVAAMQAELHNLMEKGLLRNVATNADGQTQAKKAHNLQVCPLSPKSELFRALPFEPKIIDAVTQLIGEPFVAYLDQIFLKPGRSGRGTSWHQDNAYFHVDDPTKGVGMWIAIHEANVANGTLNVIPGGHRDPFAHERDPGSNHHIRCEVDESKAVPVELPAGGALFFNYGVPHCTRSNQTDTARAGLALPFLHCDHIPEGKIRASCSTRPVLNGLETTGGVKEYGTCVAGTWPEHVERVLAAREQEVPA